MDKAFVAQRVAGKLFATEKAVDAAMNETSALLSELTIARQELNLSATVGAETTDKLVAALAALGEARAAVIASHKQLDETRLRLGIRTRMIGWADKASIEAEPVMAKDLRKAG